ncbi:hypothetical protein [Halobacterium hubeiense]|uniref:hypothetical protein n=1 Tax=Halobacterium hubeiense TaxID=1407499 RepID=UPI003C71DB3C
MSAATRVAATIMVAFVVLSLVTAAPVAAQTTDETASVTIGDIDVEPANPTTDSRTILTPTITNSETATGNAKLTEVSLRSGSVLTTADNLGRLGAGDSVDVPLAHTFDTPGERRVTVSARGTNPDGSVFVVQKSVYLTVDDRSTDVDISARAQSVNGSTGVAATLTQYGTVPVESGEIQLRSQGETVDRAPISNVSGSQSQTVTFDGDTIPAGELTVRAQYTLTDEYRTRTTTTTLQYNPQRAADMALTAIETTARGTTYTISGDASNLGGADADAVLIDVATADGLSANGGYFVGTVETSEFATFDLTVTADSPVETIPVQVNYSADGEQFSETVTVDVSDTNAGVPVDRDPRPQSGGSPFGGLPVTALAVGVLVLVGVGIVAYRWRRS